jgi:hypothetical protein
MDGTDDMSITITYSTMDHRYFMRRTKQEIIDRIEQMTGQRFDFAERFRMLHMFKDELATLAVNAARALPAPPDPVDVLVGVITAELRRQAEQPHSSSYFRDDTDVSDEVVFDGHINPRQLAQAIIRETNK